MHYKSSAKAHSDKDRYIAAINLLFYEGQIGWQMNIVFLAINAGLIALVIPSIGQFSEFWYDAYRLFLSIGGVVISWRWLFTFRRNDRYYHFRMAQAREAEPEQYSLVGDRGFRFSKGEAIEITAGIDAVKYKKDIIHQLSKKEERARNKAAMEIVIVASLILYVGMALISSIGIVLAIIKSNKILVMNNLYNPLWSGLIPSIITVVITSLILLWAYSKQFRFFNRQLIEQTRQIDSQLEIAKNQNSMTMALRLDQEFNTGRLLKVRKSIGVVVVANTIDDPEFNYKKDLSSIEYVLDFFDTLGYFTDRGYIHLNDAWHFFDAWFIPYYLFYKKYNIRSISKKEESVWSNLDTLKKQFDLLEGCERDQSVHATLQAFFLDEKELS